MYIESERNPAMTEKMKLYRRTFWGLFTAILAFSFVTLMGQQTVSSDDLTDAANRQKVDDLDDEFHAQFPDVMEVTPRQAKRLIADLKAVFIDVRDEQEQQVSMLPGSISAKDFRDNFKSYEDHVKIAYGTINQRSGKFAETLQKEGIPVFHLRGGILAWVHDGGKVYNRDGETRQVHVYNSEWNYIPAGYKGVW
jgi:rhodanese-related sulfurtransferase